MCLAVPSRVIAVDDLQATVEAFGAQRQVSLMLIDDAVAVGDYLLVRNGSFAFERLDPERGRESLDFMEALIVADGSDIQPW